MRDLRATASTASKLVHRCRGWPSVVAGIASRRPPQHLRTREGIVLTAPATVDLWNLFNSIWLQQCYLDPEELDTLGTVLDVGANVGVFALLAATQASRVVAFEPSPTNVKYLCENVALSYVRNVEVVEAAVTDVTGDCSLFLDDAPTASRVLRSPSPTAQLGRTVTVPGFSLRDAMDTKQIREVDLLKLDCEGSEFAIIAGTEVAVLRRARRIVAELHPQIAGRLEAEVLDRLTSAGFTCRLTSTGPGFSLLHAQRSGGW